MVLWTTGLAFMTATVFYQITVYQDHPAYSLGWVTGLFTLLAAVILGLRIYGNHHKTNKLQSI